MYKLRLASCDDVSREDKLYVGGRELTVDNVQSWSPNIHNGHENDSEQRTDGDNERNASCEIQDSSYLLRFEVDAFKIKRLDCGWRRLEIKNTWR